MGHKVLMFDFEREAESSGELLRFIERGNTVMVTFNFHAISQDTILLDENHEYIWEAFVFPATISSWIIPFIIMDSLNRCLLITTISVLIESIGTT